MTREDLERLREKLTSWLGATDFVEIRHGTDPDRRMGNLQAYKSPKPGRTTYCSLGLSAADWSHRRFPYRLELLTACKGREPALARVIATIALHMQDHDFLVPITDAEARYGQEEGNDAFEERLEKSGVNIFDLRRESSV